jgi:hypothetical protein
MIIFPHVTAENLTLQYKADLEEASRKKDWKCCAVCQKRNDELGNQKLKRCPNCGNTLEGVRIYYCVSFILGFRCTPQRFDQERNSQSRNQVVVINYPLFLLLWEPDPDFCIRLKHFRVGNANGETGLIIEETVVNTNVRIINKHWDHVARTSNMQDI